MDSQGQNTMSYSQISFTDSFKSACRLTDMLMVLSANEQSPVLMRRAPAMI